MGKPIAGQDKLPFSIEGINVNGASLSDGTKLYNLRIYKQRSSLEFDLINPLTSVVYQKMKIVGRGFDTEATDATLINLLSPNTFFIRAVVDNETVGFVSKFHNNLVHLIKGGSVFVPDYSVFFADPVSPIAPVETTVPQTVSTQFTKAGTGGVRLLLSPNPNSAENMIISTDGFIELALAVRLQPAVTGYPTNINPVNGTYTSGFTSTQDWTIPFSIALLSGEGAITDHYNVVLTFFGNNTGIEDEHKLSVELQESNGTLILYAPGGSITDSWVTEDLKCLQNIERYSFFSQYFVYPAVSAGTKPVGLFKIKLEATHIKSGMVTTCVAYANMSNV